MHRIPESPSCLPRSHHITQNSIPTRDVPLGPPNEGCPPSSPPAKLRLAIAAMGKPETVVGELCIELGITRQTLYRHVGPDGAIRPTAASCCKPKGREWPPTAVVRPPSTAAGAPLEVG